MHRRIDHYHSLVAGQSLDCYDSSLDALSDFGERLKAADVGRCVWLSGDGTCVLMAMEMLGSSDTMTCRDGEQVSSNSLKQVVTLTYTELMFSMA
jgi:hypothetical protein